VRPLSIYPHYGFVQWNAHYSHPAGECHARIDFLDHLAAASPQEFTRLSAQNRFDDIDAFVLSDKGDTLHFMYRDDALPPGRPGRRGGGRPPVIHRPTAAADMFAPREGRTKRSRS
jgi:hypothetical protein